MFDKSLTLSCLSGVTRMKKGHRGGASPLAQGDRELTRDEGRVHEVGEWNRVAVTAAVHRL
jgi:hypothetical protein